MVDRYAPHYAPDLRLVAVVALVPPTDLLGLANWGATHWGETGISMVAALTAMRQWYGRPEDMTSVLTDVDPYHLATNVPLWMQSGCGAPGDIQRINSLEEVYTAEFLSAARESRWEDMDPWGCYLRTNSVATSPVPRLADTPILVTYGERDNLVITAVETDSIRDLCTMGYRIQYLNCAGKGHTDGTIDTLPYAHRWTQALLAGRDPATARWCAIEGPVDCSRLPEP